MKPEVCIDCGGVGIVEEGSDLGYDCEECNFMVDRYGGYWYVRFGDVAWKNCPSRCLLVLKSEEVS